MSIENFNPNQPGEKSLDKDQNVVMSAAQAADHPLAQGIGKRLALCRAKHKLSLRRCAVLTGLSYPFLWALEKGRSLPSADSLVRLCNQYGVSADWILGLKG